MNKIVIFVGAGLSIDAGFPNWKKLTISILNDLKDKDEKISGYIETLEKGLFEPIEILGKIEHLKTFAIESLDKIIRKHEDIKPNIIHEKLHHLSTRFITTNYDELLEKCYPKFEMITYHNIYKISKMSEYENYIFKIHGDINEPDKCILFPSQYNDLYLQKEKSSIFELKKIFSDKSILFIGFSLNDPYIKFIKEYVNNLYSGFVPEHYILTANNYSFDDNRVIPIILEDYSQLEEVIDLLIKKKQSKDIDKRIEIIKEDKEEVILQYSKLTDLDIPPKIKFWVGRKREIENISNENFKVIFITGFGGQGKSALASHFINSYFNNELFEFGDWRDFKEETNRFQTKIISIIKRLTNDKFDLKNLESLNNEELVDNFFHYLGSRKIIFVFDNIDSYIDLESFLPTGGLGYLFSEALKKQHNSRFIFTCRPFIREAGINFYQISLSGLSKDECSELLDYYKLNFSEKELEVFSNEVHAITKGHPLWLNMIAAQAIRGKDIADTFIENIKSRTNFNEEDFSAILSRKILNQVWNSLNDKQQTLLRGIAETVKPESLSNLKQVLESELNNNQFDKAFKILKNLNLIETKSSSFTEDQIELHPLVKEFILTKYPRTERVKFITLLVKYYDSFIYVLKPNLSSNLSLKDFQNWTTKIELEINKADFKPALIVMQEVSNSILSAGFAEEYLRVAEKLYDTLDWSQAIEKEYTYFHNQLYILISTLTHYGKFAKSKEYLDKYAQLIPGKSAHYLAYCSEMCYLYWFQNQFEDAINYGEKGEFLLTNSGLSDNNSLKHNLALARRDSKNHENLTKALNYFLKDEDLNDILNSNISKKELSGSFYGNIGRCLYFMNDNENSLKCYFNSLEILLKEDYDNSKINLGYAYYWIGEIMLKQTKIKEGLYFYKNAIQVWNKISPPKANKIKKIFKDVICDKETKSLIDKKAEWEIEKFCSQILIDYKDKN